MATLSSLVARAPPAIGHVTVRFVAARLITAVASLLTSLGGPGS